MNGPLAAVVVVASVALALWALVHVARDRPVDGPLLIGAVVVEVLLLVYLVVGLVQTITADGDVERATLVGYLLGLVLIPPVAVVWSLEEKSRSGTAVLALAYLVVPVMVARVVQVWGGAGA